MTPQRKKTLEDINLHCKSNSLLLVDKKGKLRIISTPFYVLFIEDDEHNSQYGRIRVDEVKINTDLVLLFIVQNNPYPYFIFILPDESLPDAG